MKLTKEQEDILNGKEGEFKQGLMRLLVDWGYRYESGENGSGYQCAAQ